MRFEVVSKYADANINLPVRKTAKSAGYDFEVAEDTVIPSYFKLMDKMMKATGETSHTAGNFTLSEIARVTKDFRAKPTLVPTGIKCEIPDGYYLELSVRSSCPLKYWLILANGIGVIDADYYNNPDNEGHIYFQIINLSPFDILLKKGDTIGQGILKKYYTTDDDTARGERTGGFGSTSVNEDCVMARAPENAVWIVDPKSTPSYADNTMPNYACTPEELRRLQEHEFRRKYNGIFN